jgi:hypothetical protein
MMRATCRQVVQSQRAGSGSIAPGSVGEQDRRNERFWGGLPWRKWRAAVDEDGNIPSP